MPEAIRPVPISVCSSSEPVGSAGPRAFQAEEIAHARAHQDEPGDARFRECDIVPHQEIAATRGAANACAGAITLRRTRIARATLAAMVSAPTATCTTVRATITGIGCTASA